MPNIKVIIGIGFLIALVLTNGLTGYKAYQWGELSKQAEWDAAELQRATELAEAQESTKNKQLDIMKQSNEVKYEIRKNQEGNRPVSPVLRAQLERMRTRQLADQ